MVTIRFRKEGLKALDKPRMEYEAAAELAASRNVMLPTLSDMIVLLRDGSRSVHGIADRMALRKNFHWIRDSPADGDRLRMIDFRRGMLISAPGNNMYFTPYKKNAYVEMGEGPYLVGLRYYPSALLAVVSARRLEMGKAAFIIGGPPARLPSNVVTMEQLRELRKARRAS